VTLHAAVAAALVLGACAAAGADSTRLVERRTLAAQAPPTATHALTLHIFHFAGTRWKIDDITRAIAPAAELLAQCGVALERTELATLNAERRFHFYYTPISRELVRELRAPRPAVFFVEDTRNNPAFDAEAIGLANAARRPELANTIWIAYGTRDLDHAIAHELVHVLSDSGEHSSDPANLMHEETSARNTALTAAQCERLRSRGQANGLLVRRSDEVMK
jgi:hypothetical protein